MARRRIRNRLHRADPKGNLYYVRLNTEYGVFYKLGFTTFGSVKARMSYKGSTDWQYIDKVLMFKNLPDAFEVEQKLHAYLDKKRAFAEYSANQALPLYRNGQTELYIEDVLHLDFYYSESQSVETLRKLKDKKIFVAYKSQDQENFELLIIKFFTILLSPLGLIIIILMSKLEGGDTKKEVSDFFERLTGNNKEKEIKEEAEIRDKIENILRSINS